MRLFWFKYFCVVRIICNCLVCRVSLWWLFLMWWVVIFVLRFLVFFSSFWILVSVLLFSIFCFFKCVLIVFNFLSVMVLVLFCIVVFLVGLVMVFRILFRVLFSLRVRLECFVFEIGIKLFVGMIFGRFFFVCWVSFLCCVVIKVLIINCDIFVVFLLCNSVVVMIVLCLVNIMGGFLMLLCWFDVLIWKIKLFIFLCVSWKVKLLLKWFVFFVICLLRLFVL